MMNNDCAKIREVRPVCRQGRLLIAIENTSPVHFFVLCEDCESEWESPEDISDLDLATRNQHQFLRYAVKRDLLEHPWRKFVLN
ncbi:MAG: hypothetical protein IPP74_06910 [Alphaproteobacteria bacterium]|nr:hypothetical protein [Alphaproteobacteria bacterium]